MVQLQVTRLRRTPERFVPTYQDDAYFAFLSLYAAIEHLIVDRSVLDAGCGAGYGSFYLAERGAKSVVAFDASLAAVQYGLSHYKASNLHFVLGDCTDLPFPAGGFDLVFSSNVVEHIADYGAYLREIKRVMKQDGLLVLVTPPVYENVQVGNPFHVTNFTAQQWKRIIRQHFSHMLFFKHYTRNRNISFTRPLTDAEAAILASREFAGQSPELQAFLRRKIFNPLDVDLGDWEMTIPATLRELEEPLTCSVVVICTDNKGLHFSGVDRERLLEWRVESLRNRLAETEMVLFQLLTSGLRTPKADLHMARARKALAFVRSGDLRGLIEEVKDYFRWRKRQ